MTPIYGITTAQGKRTRRDLRVLPKTVLYDPELVSRLPFSVAAASGINAFAHIVQALSADASSPITDLLAQEGGCILVQALERLRHDPADLEGFEMGLYGAYLAGTILATVGTGLHHRICHILGGRFHLPHAQTHAVMLPYVVWYNQQAAPEGMTRLARMLRSEHVAQGIVALTRRLGLPQSLADLGLAEERLEEVARLVVASPLENVRPVVLADVQSLLQAAYQGVPDLFV